MHVHVSDFSHRELYNIILNSVAPRPIAWVSSLSVAGQLNLAPFSFFNCVCTAPLLLAFAPSLREPQDSAPQTDAKDTLRNMRETKECVISVVTYDVREPMNVSSGEDDRSVN